MSKSTQSKLNYAARRELRLRRDKVATALLAALVSKTGVVSGTYIADAVELADNLIAELDRTRPEFKVSSDPEE